MVEYQAALVGVVVGGYAAVRGARALGRYAPGVLPGLALLGLYDRAAFGSPFHLSYRYVSSQFAARQAGGFFGMHAPSWHAARLVLIGNRGLIVVAPVLVLAAHQMRRRAGPAMRIGDRSFFLRPGDEFGNVVDRQGRMHEQRLGAVVDDR